MWLGKGVYGEGRVSSVARECDVRGLCLHALWKRREGLEKNILW